MNKTDIQNKTAPLKGTVENYRFENKAVGLKSTLFHRITVPLRPFDSGLEYVSQPEETEIVIEWLKLNLKNADDLDKTTITSQENEDLEASVYLGSAHNRCKVNKLTLDRLNGDTYLLECDLSIDFETEGVGNNEKLSFETTVDFQR